MRNRMTWLAALSIVGLLAVVLASCTPAQAAQQTAAPTASQDISRHITVVGVGEVNLKPDIARINVGAEASASTVSEAKQEVDDRLAAILNVLQEMGIAERDIQTSQYSIYYEREPVYPMAAEEGVKEATGAYRVTSMLNVTIRDLDRVDEVLDAVVEAGANQMYGVTFTVSDEQEWEKEAREKAMADAKARAEELAGLAGVELGEVLTVSEIVGSSVVPVARVALESAAVGGGGIVPGELELSTQIQVTFAIR